jgi:hypothetical protein
MADDAGGVMNAQNAKSDIRPMRLSESTWILKK